MNRPEGGDSSAYPPPDGYDRDAWQRFTPYSPGDGPSDRPTMDPAGPWWTETPARSERGRPDEVAHEFRRGEQVRSLRGVGSVLGGAVPAGTEGRVVAVQRDLFVRVTVEFANGYTETDAIRYESGWL